MNLSKEKETEMEKVEGFNHFEPFDPLNSLLPFLYLSRSLIQIRS